MDNTAWRAREVKEGEDYLAVVNYFYLTEHCRFHIFVKQMHRRYRETLYDSFSVYVSLLCSSGYNGRP